MKAVLYCPHIHFNNEDSAFKMSMNGSERKDYDVKFSSQFNIKDFDKIQEVSTDVDKFVLEHQRRERVQYEGVSVEPDGKINHNTLLESLVYYPCVVNMTTLNNTPENIDNLLFYYKMQEPFGLVMEFDRDEIAVESEVELKMWIQNSMSIYETIEKYHLNGDVEGKLILSLPKRTFKLYINQHANCYLEDCKIIDRVEDNKFTVLVTKIVFYQK